jgi:hypothetical protein
MKSIIVANKTLLIELLHEQTKISATDSSGSIEWLPLSSESNANNIEFPTNFPSSRRSAGSPRVRSSYPYPDESFQQHIRLLVAESIAPHDQVELVTPPSISGTTTQLHAVADSTLITMLCRARSIIPIRLNGHTSIPVELAMHYLA